MQKNDFRGCPFCGGSIRVGSKFITDNNKCNIKFECDKCQTTISLWGKDETDCMQKWRWRPYPDCYITELDKQTDTSDNTGMASICVRYKTNCMVRILTSKKTIKELLKATSNCIVISNSGKGPFSVNKATPNFFVVEDNNKNKVILNLNEIEYISVHNKEDEQCTTK